MSHEPVSREEVLGALEHTFARGAAQIEFRIEFDLYIDESRPPPVRLGPHLRRLVRRPSRQAFESLLRAIGRLLMHWAGKLAVSTLRRLLKRWIDKLVAQPAVGIVDFGAHRCMYGHPGRSEVTLVAGDEYWHGAAGTAVDDLSKKPASVLQPLWLLDLVRGVEETHAIGDERVDGHTCRHLVGHADLNRAADAVCYEMPVPQGMDQLGQLARLSLELWVDPERQIRRIRHHRGERAATSTSTLDLREFGVEPPSDWSRLNVPARLRARCVADAQRA